MIVYHDGRKRLRGVFASGFAWEAILQGMRTLRRQGNNIYTRVNSTYEEKCDLFDCYIMGGEL